MTSAIDAMNVIKGYDTFCVEYVKKYSGIKHETTEQKTEFKDPLEELKHAIISGDDAAATNAAKKVMEKGIDLLNAAAKGMVPAMDVVGQYFKSGKYFLPQVVLSAQAMKKAFTELKKHNSDQKVKSLGRVLMATVKGDIHDIGKNIVITLLETNSFEVVDLGKSVPTDEIVKKAKELTPDIIGLSALMTTTMDEMGAVVSELKKQGVSIPVMVGGAVVTNEFAQSIGAKFYAKDAMQAVDILKKLKS
jgi:5-methyltetrahydrofolate--homocysteine methyltransferase